MPIQMTRAQRNARLAALIATGGPLDPADTWINVASSFTDNELDTVLADFTEGTGAGFARQLITAWGAPHELINGSLVVDSGLHIFSPTAIGDIMQVVAVFLVDAATAGVPKEWVQVIPPIGLANTSQSLSIVYRVILNPDGTWNSAVLING